MKPFIKLCTLLLITAGLAPDLMAQRSLYSDVKAHRPGDILTVVLSENITGSSSSDTRSQSSTNGSASSGVSGTMLPLEAAFGANAELDFNSDEVALANQRQLLSGTLSVRIREVDNTGNFLVDGSRSMEISGEIYSMALTGIVRPEDISDGNEVLSYRIADAEIVYLNEGGGLSGMMRKNGFEKRLLWGVVGIITGISAIMAAK